MTLRDFFAAKALPLAMEGYRLGIGAKNTDIDWETSGELSVVASRAYRLADAMLEARSINTLPPPAKTITDAQIDAIANGMPGGLDGFLKGWGWRHFARAILAASNGEAAVPTPAQVQEGQ